MSPEEYITQRVDDQINWYNNKSKTAQTWFKRIRRAELICAASIPFLAGYSDSYVAAQVVVGLLGALVVLLASLVSFGQYQENWIEYRATCQSLNHEKYLYLAKIAPYDIDDRFSIFVQRVETLLSKEHSTWSQHTRDGIKSSGKNKQKNDIF